MDKENLQKQIDELKAEIKKLTSVTTIPYDVEQAFRARLGIANFTALGPSVKTAASETQAVSEGGSASYNVAKAPDGFREFTTGGVVYYVPIYNIV